MIIGIGIDLVEIKRIEKNINETTFLQKYFTVDENKLFELSKHKAQTVAGNFASKEAISKAIGTGFRGFSLTDIEILRDEMGNPYVNSYGSFKSILNELKIDTIHVSISNTKEYAVANAICERRGYNENCNLCTNEKYW